jgi:hypothetical protein
MNSFFSHIPKRSKWRVPRASLLTQRHTHTHTHTHHNEWERERRVSERQWHSTKLIGKCDTEHNGLDSLGWQILALLTYS